MRLKFYCMATLLVCLFVGFMVSCTPDTPVTPVDPSGEVKVVQVDASSKENWTYFSFSKGEVVSITPNAVLEVPKGVDWDIAFYRNTIRVNCGTSGEGKGGAVMTEIEDFEQLNAVPSDNFVVDTIGNILAMPMIEGASFNTVMSQWAPFDMSTMPPGVELSKKVFVVRCADGATYAKIKFLEYTDDKGQRFYPKFKYFYPFK